MALKALFLNIAQTARILEGPPGRVRGRRSQDLASLANLVASPDFRILLQARIGVEEAGALIATVQDVADEAEAMFTATDYAPMRGRLVRRDDTTVEIIATLDTVPAIAHLVGAELQQTGVLELHHEGGSDVLWDEQATVRTVDGGRSFVDAKGGIVTETNVALRLENGELLVPALRFASVVAG